MKVRGTWTSRNPWEGTLVLVGFFLGGQVGCGFCWEGCFFFFGGGSCFFFLEATLKWVS